MRVKGYQKRRSSSTTDFLLLDNGGAPNGPAEDRAERTKAFVFAPSESTLTQSSTCEDWSKEDTDTILDALKPYEECP